MGDEKKVIELKYSIPVPKEGGGSVEVNKLQIGRLKLKHLKLLPKDFVEKEGKVSPDEIIPLIAGMANISEECAGEIDFDDIERVADTIMNFLAESPQIGKK